MDTFLHFPSALPASRFGGRRAFTLLEVVVVIALIGLLTALVAGGSMALLRDHPATGEEILRSAMTQSRREAVTSLQEVRLSYDAKARCFLLSRGGGLRKLPVEVTGELQVEFLPAASGNAMLLGGNMVETEKLTHVTFFPDGACSPFRAQIRTGGPARIMSFDPWTCAEVMEAKP